MCQDFTGNWLVISVEHVPTRSSSNSSKSVRSVGSIETWYGGCGQVKPCSTASDPRPITIIRLMQHSEVLLRLAPNRSYERNRLDKVRSSSACHFGTALSSVNSLARSIPLSRSASRDSLVPVPIKFVMTSTSELTE